LVIAGHVTQNIARLQARCVHARTHARTRKLTYSYNDYGTSKVKWTMYMYYLFIHNMTFSICFLLHKSDAGISLNYGKRSTPHRSQVVFRTSKWLHTRCGKYKTARYVLRNIEARSRNHPCPGKATSTTYSECVSVA